VAEITPANRVFNAVADALGFTDGSAVTKYELGPVRPRQDVQASIESGIVNYSEFILLRTDVGAVTTTVNINPHTLADWTEIRNRGRTLVGLVGSEVPGDHDAWIISAGVTVTVVGAISNAEIFTETPTLGAGVASATLWFGDVANPRGGVMRAASRETPYTELLPWYMPPNKQQVFNLRFRLQTNAAVSTNLLLGVLSAPQGVFRRLY